MPTKALLTLLGLLTAFPVHAEAPSFPGTKPNIILIMTDDQGWGQTGYYGHPVLKTPNLDAMAGNGLRLDRFYAAGPVCSPTRASVLTGRTHDRTGVPSHGNPLRRQEKTLAISLGQVGYSTGHFGKWHLNGLRGPGVPVLGDDTHSPGAFGFDTWLSVTNFFDIDPLMSRKGSFENFEGDSSAVIVGEALKFIESSHEAGQPFLAVIWDGSPHSPWRASAADRAAFQDLEESSQHHYGELVAFDRSVGVLRQGLRDLGIEQNTMLWYCSDNGGLPNLKPDTVGGLRGYKGSLYEGGIRVPCIIEWPAVIKPRTTSYPASTMDIFPTIVDILDLPQSALLKPVDGISLYPIFDRSAGRRTEPIPFRYQQEGALIDNEFKLYVRGKKQIFELFNLNDDPEETTDLSKKHPELLKKMKSVYAKWDKSVDASVAGMDYPEAKVHDDVPERRFWMDDEQYRPFLEAWSKRPEYSGVIRKRRRQ